MNSKGLVVVLLSSLLCVISYSIDQSPYQSGSNEAFLPNNQDISTTPIDPKSVNYKTNNVALLNHRSIVFNPLDDKVRPFTHNILISTFWNI